MNENFSFSIMEENKTDELIIKGAMDYNPKSIYLKKYSISWIITTLRNMTEKDYNTYNLEREIETSDYYLSVSLHVHDDNYSWLDIFPIWENKAKKHAPIEIPYNSSNKNLLMGEFIEPFLTALEKYISEEERAKLPKPWPDNMTREQWEEYRKNKPKGNGKSKITFVKEIKPEDYFK
jgi:hypothetical protein